MVTNIVFKCGVSTGSYKDRLWQPKWNFPGKEPYISFEDKAYWCSVSHCEGYDRRQKGIAGKGGHFEEYCRCIDKICEL